MSVLRNQIIEEHINKNYPNSKLLNYNDPDSDLVFYSAEELQNIEEDWFPLCCYKDSNTGKAMYGGRKKVFHTYTEGETGAGKTTRFVMQSILALSSLKVKPSFVIVDIHGEIIESLYNHLKANGYSIKILNCDNPQRSDTYNPFAELTKECLWKRDIGNDTINKIRKISEIIQPVETSNDPIWEQGARSYTNGCILDKFEDLIKGDIPEECVTIYNVIQNHYWLRDSLSGGDKALFKIPHYKRKGTKALSTQKMISVTNNADKTRASYFGVIENHYDAFGQPSFYSLSSSNTIDISNFIDNPTAIVIQSGSTKIGDDLISLLVNDIYTKVVKKGKASKDKKLPRSIHCFLDEFANCNIADGPEYIKMLTTSRKFGMYWHMILQCDAQLDRKFDPNIGRIIRANSTEIFMGSHDYETEARFAKSCGQKTIESLSSAIVQQDPRLEVVDLMTTEQLNLTEEGYAYVKSNRQPLTKTYIEAFYKCKEFVPVDDIDSIYPYNHFNYRQTAFYPDDIPEGISNAEYDILKYIAEDEKTLLEITANFPKMDVKKQIKRLAQKDMVDLLDDHVVKSNVTKRQLSLYDYRSQHGMNYVSDPAVPEFGPPRYASPFDSAEWSNPFDFDEEQQEGDSGEIDKWLNNVEREELSLFADLRKYAKAQRLTDVTARLKNYTFIPEFLANALISICKAIKNGEDLKHPDVPFPNSSDVVKFEILEEYIKNNDCRTKAIWVSKMQEEYERLEVDRLFPESIMISFRKALDELRTDLTIINIREIKKIISDNP